MGGVPVQRPASFRAVFAVGEFRAVWLAELQSTAGDQLARVALSILVFQRTDSAALTALTYALTQLPDLVAGPLLSGLADRFPRRRVMVVCDVARAALLAVMAIPGVSIAALAALLVVVQLFNAPFTAAQAATVPAVFDDDHDRMVVGQAVRQVTRQVGLVVGFAGGGALVALLGTSEALAADAVTFALSALLIGFGVRARPAPQSADTHTTSTLRRLATGARVIWADRMLRSLVGLAWLAGFVVVPEGLAAPYAAEIGAGPGAVGLLLAAHPAGLAAGSFAVRWLGPVRRLVLVAPLAVGAIAPLIGFAFRPGLPMAMALLVVSGACGAYQTTASATFMREVPNTHRGQAFGLAGSGLIAVQGLGVAAGGVLAQAIGSAAAAITVAGLVGIPIGLLAAAAWQRSGWRNRSVAVRDDTSAGSG